MCSPSFHNWNEATIIPDSYGRITYETAKAIEREFWGILQF